MAKAEENFCDVCGKQVAVYVEKKRRRGRLTRDRLCAGCLREHAKKEHAALDNPLNAYRRIEY